MPSSLIGWLLEGRNEKQTTHKSSTLRLTTCEYKYDLTEDHMNGILNQLPEQYLNNYSDWFRATGVLKHHDMHYVWDTWSKQSFNYNLAKKYQPME